MSIAVDNRLYRFLLAADNRRKEIMVGSSDKISIVTLSPTKVDDVYLKHTHTINPLAV